MDLRKSSSIYYMLSDEKFMLIVLRLRSRHTSLSSGRLWKYAFHRPRAGVSLFEKERLEGNIGRFCAAGCLLYSYT
jgi:hypothetical protein